MPFKKINTKEIVGNKKDKDNEFKKYYNEIIAEYILIRKVVERRKELGLTQKNLADKRGVKQQVISRFEREKHMPTLDNFIKILDGLDLEILIDKKRIQ